MSKIKGIIVINEASASDFATALKKATNELEDRDLEVTINNPHLIVGGIFNYVAVVEGRSKKDDMKSAQFPSFNIKS